MVRSKAPPQHVEVQPLQCVVYITRNPVTFEIHRRCEFYLLDQQAREKKTPSRVQEACPHAARDTCNYHYDQECYSSQM